MKRYRIKNYNRSGYIVQERILLFFWHTLQDSNIKYPLLFFNKIFDTIEDAKDHIKEMKLREQEFKKAKHTEYV